tara:strand:+ start:1493 stop:1687 length:195 start_codon:yes stop_codon:yes gene_type:complete
VPTFDEVYLNSLKDIKESHENALIAGSVKTMEDYKQICGFLRGIDMAIAEYKKLVSHVEGDDSL